MIEEYREILGYRGYEISTLGNVRNAKTGRVLKPRKHDQGYRNVYIKSNEGNYKNRYIHRLVAFEFLPCNVGEDEVDHIDRDKTNNRIDNLRWVTRSENSKNYCRENRLGQKLKTTSEGDILQILSLHDGGASTVQISKLVGIPRQTIYSILIRRDHETE